MKKLIFFLILLTLVSGVSFGQQKRVLTLEETIELARQNSRSAKRAETQRTLGYWNYRVYRAQLKPQLLLRGTLPNFIDRATPVTQNDGTVQFRTINQNTSDLSLGFEQVLPWTNTTVSLDTRLQRFDNFSADQTVYQGDPIGISITQPLFAVNPFKWDNETRPLEYEQSKRRYVQDMEQTSRTAARLFFQLLVEQKNLEIALQNESANDTVFRIEQGRYNLGTSTEDQLLQTELNLLTAESEAQQARLDLQTRSLELRNFIGLTENVELELTVPDDAPNFQIEYETALRYAKDNRAEFLDFQLDRLEAERSVAEARARRFNADLTAGFGFNSAQTNSLSDVYNNDFNATGSRIRLGFAIPLLDGGRNKARMNQAKELQRLTTFNIEQEQINFEQEISNAVRNFEQILGQIQIAETRQQVALKSFEITNGRYLAGKVGILDLNNARQTKDAGIRNYISSLQQYWDAYYELRTLTLYDFQNNNLLYNPLLEYDPKSDTMIETQKY